MVIPTIVMAELLFIARKQQWEKKFSAVFSSLQRDPRVSLVPFSVAILETLATLPELEMHDGVIVATALATDCAVMTCDRAIVASQRVPVVSP